MRWPRGHSDSQPDFVALSLREQLLAESEAMAAYALASGLRVPASALHVLAQAGEPGANGAPRPLDATDWRRLVRAHEQLVQVVTPATPRTLLLLSEDAADGRLQALGPVALVRRMLWAGVVLLVVFLLTALSPKVSHASGDIFSESGTDLLVNELFLLSAAGIGAAFAALFTANHYIAEGTYDPKYEASYWVRFVLGLIAGIVLSSLVPIKAPANGGETFTRPFLALLGGFSASVVFRILTRLVGTLESLLQGDSGDGEMAKKRLAVTEAAHIRTQDQLRVSSALVKLREQVAAGVTSGQLLSSISVLIDDMLPVDIDRPDAPVAAPASATAQRDPPAPAPGLPPRPSAEA